MRVGLKLLNRQGVKDFIGANNLSKLSIREVSKYIKKTGTSLSISMMN